MYSPPADPADQHRMRKALAHLAQELGAEPQGPEVWGWHGRTLSTRAKHPEHGACWLRMATAPEDRAGGKVWDGNREAASLFDGCVNKPKLHAIEDDQGDGHAYRAELHQHIDELVCAASPVLTVEPDVPASWWHSLRADLKQVASIPTERVAVRQEWVDRSVPRFLDMDAPQITDWTTAHGDLHAANLTAHTPYLLDWEGFGQAPAGYDAAMLLTYSLLAPDFAQHVRDAFPVLKTDAGRTAQIIVITELMQSASRGDHPELVPALQALATDLA